MKNLVKAAASFFRKEDCFCLLCHKNLDGDTLGAAFSIYYSLKQMGKKVVVRTVYGEYIKKFKYLYPDEEDLFVFFRPKHYVTVDVGNYSLLEDKFSNFNFSLSIDHHKNNMLKANIKCIDSNKAATCEITYLILKELQISLTKKIADCLYTGLATDTGCFRYSNTSSFSHIMAAELIDLGANIEKINFEILEKKSKKRLQIERYIFNNLEYYFEDKVVMAFIGLEFIEAIDAKKEEYSSLSSVISCIEGAIVFVTAQQEKDIIYKISVRSRGNFDASLFCKNFGGGGHKKAAGCKIKGDEIIVRKKLLKCLEGRF